MALRTGRTKSSEGTGRTRARSDNGCRRVKRKKEEKSKSLEKRDCPSSKFTWEAAAQRLSLSQT